MLPSVYTSCQESQTNGDLLLKVFLQQRPFECCHLPQVHGQKATQRGSMAKEEPPRVPHRQGCILCLSTAKAGLKEGLPVGTAGLGKHSCSPGQLRNNSYAILHFGSLKKKPFSYRKIQSYEIGPPETGLFSIGLCCWFASACRVLLGCCRDED